TCRRTIRTTSTQKTGKKKAKQPRPCLICISEDFQAETDRPGRKGKKWRDLTKYVSAISAAERSKKFSSANSKSCSKTSRTRIPTRKANEKSFLNLPSAHSRIGAARRLNLLALRSSSRPTK